ncbi:MAG: hypothetical protein PHY93_19110 [Bacteriovorax sp.]|nr:hypothetical protein [Bacteriovorax sp.]
MINQKKITFLLGAGASRNACPILKEQGEKMIELARIYFDNPDLEFEEKPKDLDEKKRVMWDIGFFGNMSLKFGTIDTYAKKLSLNNSYRELSRLKLSVSLFFTIWQLTNNKKLKSCNSKSFDDIDRRYISLMASIIEQKDHISCKLNDNVRFVTWNYDLQLEYAFKSFCREELSWDYISQDLRFRISDKSTPNLEICHLNGYHGFYKTDRGDYHILDRTNSMEINEILDSISFTSTSLSQGTIDITNHINYAWENNYLAEASRNEAFRIFSETDIVIIIGYSFPNFNKEIDKELFDRLKGRHTKVYYQDPNASPTLIYQIVNSEECDVICEPKKLDNFILPYEF